MKETLTKSMKAKLRALSGVAHERELAAALSVLESDFARWRDGKLDPFELSDLIHGFHDGPAKALYKRYVFRPEIEWNVAHALEREILSEREAGPQVMAAIAQRLNFLRLQGAQSGPEADPH